MPSESVAPPPPPTSTSLGPVGGSSVKCTYCGGNGLPSRTQIQGRIGVDDGGVSLEDQIERVCGCHPPSSDEIADGEEVGSLGLGLRGMDLGYDRSPIDDDNSPRSDSQPQLPDSPNLPSPPSLEASPSTPHPPTLARPVGISPAAAAESSSSSWTGNQASSLPAQHTQPWSTHRHATRVGPIREEQGRDSDTSSLRVEDRPFNPLLDLTTSRVSNLGRGALYPGSVFKGTQTSGRSAYDVEVRFADVNFPESTVSGYLSISHLTDTHPHLTTFFTGEIIGPKFGFITGSRYGATEHDDMRHWGRFEQFRRPATRADMIRPELIFRDPLSRPAVGPGMERERGMERDFVFLRIKERFLVPDHTVRDISGASFAGESESESEPRNMSHQMGGEGRLGSGLMTGFYFAMIDLNPNAASAEPPLSPSSPTIPKSPLPITSNSGSIPMQPGSPTTSNSQYFPYTPQSTPPTPSARRQSAVIPPPAPPGFAGLPSLPTFAMPAPPTVRRMSSTGPTPRSPAPASDTVLGGSGSGTRRRRESAGQNMPRMEREPQREATIRGYYFHSLNQEPFQELFLTHVPMRSSGIYEMR